MPDAQRVHVTVERRGCGCGGFIAFCFVVAIAELAGEWIGDHPGPAIAFGIALLAVLGLAAFAWAERRPKEAPQQPPLASPSPERFCNWCGTAMGPGPFCGECGRQAP